MRGRRGLKDVAVEHQSIRCKIFKGEAHSVNSAGKSKPNS